MLDHEKLDVYQCALQFAGLAFRILNHLPTGSGELSDQLRRATISLPLNIAEASGRSGEKDRARFYSIARGSALECAAVIDILRIQSLIEPEHAAQARAFLVRLTSMLTKMCR